MTVPFGTKLRAAFDRYGQVCLGVDAHPATLSFHNLEDSALGAERLFMDLLEAAITRVGVMKVQVALFERFGSAGFLALERVFERMRQSDILLIADIKRGEIGTSMAGYISAWLGSDSPLLADAITVNPYLGVGALDDTFRYASAHGRGVFVLAANSNPESFAMQMSGTPSLAARVVAEVFDANMRLETEHSENRSTIASDQQEFGQVSDGSLSDIGLVIGATVKLENYGISGSDLGNSPILAPGFGHQGAQIADLRRLFGSLSENVLVAESRSLVHHPMAEIPSRIAENQAAIQSALAEVV
ncbi:MAG: orotidine-5'-phosphate decarboxylase [Microbacteriaceae bacterium]